MSKKTFSIFVPMVDAFKTFSKNWMLFLCAGALMSSIHLLDNNLIPDGSGKLYREVSQVVKHDLPNSQSAQEFFNNVGHLRSFLRGHPEPFKYYGYGIVFTCLMLFLVLGFINLALNLGGKKPAHLGMFLIEGRQFARMIGAVAIVAGIMVSFGPALDALDIFLSWFDLPLSCKLLIGFVALLVFFVAMMHFAFTLWCSLDTAKSSTDALACSARLVRGNLGRVIAFALLFCVFIGLCREFLFFFLNTVAPVVPVPGFAAFLVGTVMTPIFLMGWTSAYRQLK